MKEKNSEISDQKNVSKAIEENKYKAAIKGLV